MTEKKKPEVKVAKVAVKKEVAKKAAPKSDEENKRGRVPGTVGKLELTDMVAKKLDYPIAPTKAIIDCFINTIIDVVKKNKPVLVYGLFKAEIKSCKSRKGRNPKTGESLVIPAKKVIKMKKVSSFKL